MRSSILILATILAIGGCTSSAAHEELIDREWKLTWVEGFPTLPSGAATPTIRFGSDGRIAGNTGCNTAGAAYAIEEGRLNIEAMITTKRACLEQRANELESAYVRAVGATRSYRIEGGELHLLDDAGKTVARFR